MDGYETCSQLKAAPETRDIPVIFITARDEIEGVVAGFAAGGVDYVVKPFRQEEVLARVRTHLEKARLMQALQQKNRDLEAEVARREALTRERNKLTDRLPLADQREVQRWGLGEFVGQSRTLKKILDALDLLQGAQTTSVLILGESGTGKELVARAIHAGSDRAEGPFVPVNCASIPRELADSLLFGHVKGAFTGTDRDQAGCFELAHGGTLFLDEVGLMPLELQPKLLRVLEDRTILPLGARQPRQVDVRMLAATNIDVQAQIAVGNFRQDLYYRLAHFTVQVPSLRERREDIGLLARHFLQVFALEMGIVSPALSPEAVALLEQYDFPGNIRELKNLVERALIESRRGEIRPEHLHLPAAISPLPGQPLAVADGIEFGSLPPELDQALAQIEIALIKRALAQTSENLTAAARLLDTNRNRIYRALGKQPDIAANHTIAASFAINTYTITASAEAHGSISPPGEATINYGVDQAYTLTAEAGYHITDVLVDGSSVGAVETYTFTGVANNHTIAASFAINTYTLTATAVVNGSITPAGATVVNYGASQVYTITPNTGYRIADVLVDGVSVDAVETYSFSNVTANHTLSASFAIDTFTLTASAGAGGSISPSGTTTVSYGTNQGFTIAPAPGYDIAEVLVDGGSVGAVGTYTFTNVAATHTIAASFADKTSPVVTAALTAISRDRDEDEDEDGNFYRITATATDLVDPNPVVSALITQPLTASTSMEVRYKREKKNRIQIKMEKRKLQVELSGPSEVALRALWSQALADGGFAVSDGQTVQLVLKKDKDEYEAQYRFDTTLKLTSAKGPGLKLAVWASDASGNPSPRVQVAPSKSGAAKVVSGGSMPTRFSLEPNYPNPFNPATTLRYNLVEAGQVRLTVYNVAGQQIRVLADQAQEAGAYQVEWDATDASGQQVAPGLYLYRLVAGDQMAVGKMLLLK